MEIKQYNCISADTQILTARGWKDANTIRVLDEVYSLDVTRNKIIKNSCQHIFCYDFAGQMVNIKNQNTDQLVTPNHHCLVQDVIKTKTKGGQVNYVKHDYWVYKDAWQIRSGTTKFPLAGSYSGKLMYENLFCELVGLIIADGCYNKQNDYMAIYQSEVNEKILQRIRYILGKLKIPYSEYIREKEYADPKHFIHLSDEKLGKTYLYHEFYLGSSAKEWVKKIRQLCPSKKLHWGLLELEAENKEYLLKGLCEGDGRKSNYKFGFGDFYQNDMEELEVFQALLHMTNKQGWINKKKMSCSIHLNPTTEIQGKHYKNRLVDYEGYVWCIETEIGNFMARRNGKIFITGNSFPIDKNLSV